MQFDKETFTFEGDFPYFGPGEGIDTCYILKDSNTHMSHGQIQWHTIMIFGGMHFHAIQFTASGRLQEIQIGLGRRLTTEREGERERVYYREYID